MTEHNTIERLKERIEELEAQQQEQQETIKKMLPSRRQVLGGVGAAGAGLVVGSSSGSGSTGTAGQIGTQSDRPDLYGDSVDANSVNTDDLRTPPTGSIVSLSSNQSIANDTATTVEWDTETSRGDVSGLLDTNNNNVVVPSGYDYAKATFGYFINVSDTVSQALFTINGNSNLKPGQGSVNPSNANESRINVISSAWVPVSQGDTIGNEIAHVDGSSADLQADNRTFLEIWLR